MKKKQKALLKKVILPLIALIIVLIGGVLAYLATSDKATKDIGSRAAQTEIVIRAWEFNTGTSAEGWRVIKNAIMRVRGKALRVAQRQKAEAIIEQPSSIRLRAGSKKISFAATVQPFTNQISTVSAGLCPSRTISCSNRTTQPAYNAQCWPITCPNEPFPISLNPVTIMIGYLTGGKWYDYPVTIGKSNNFQEYSITIPEVNPINVSKIRFTFPADAYDNLISIDWIRLSFSPLPTTILTPVTSTPTPIPTGKFTPTPTAGCIRTGCNGLNCVDSRYGGKEGASVCGMSQQQACLAQYGVCERQKDNNCGWTKTAKYDSCLSQITPGPSLPPQPTSPYGGLCSRITSASACNADSRCYWDYVSYYCYGK